MSHFWFVVQQMLYRIGIRMYGWSIHLASLFSNKAGMWVNGRRNWVSLLQQNLPPVKPGIKRYWFHCASLGEFEQGRPVIEEVRKRFPDAQILLSFFSPSGYEIRKDYQVANFVFYLPLDTPKNARKLLDVLQPDQLLLVKYEFWYEILKQTAARNIPISLVSGLFRENHWMFKHASSFGRRILQTFTHFFLQDEASARLLKGFGFTNVFVTGDCRVDRVMELARFPKKQPQLDEWTKDSANTLVAGSTWEPDEQLLSEVFSQSSFQSWKVILAPHDISESHLRKIEQLWPRPITRYTQFIPGQSLKGDCLLDTIGDLGSAYQFATIAYIGGGFGNGIHNTLEPAAYLIPVVFGPRYQKFTEAVELQYLGVARSVQTVDEAKSAFQEMLTPDQTQSNQTTLLNFFARHSGATERILKHLVELV